jgi:hypothetical protein
MNRTQKSVGILAGSAIVLVDIGYNVALRRAPEALEEAKSLGSLSLGVRKGLAKSSSQRTGFDKSAMLVGNGEKTRSIDFLP